MEAAEAKNLLLGRVCLGCRFGARRFVIDSFEGIDTGAEFYYVNFKKNISEPEEKSCAHWTGKLTR